MVTKDEIKNDISHFLTGEFKNKVRNTPENLEDIKDRLWQYCNETYEPVFNITIEHNKETGMISANVRFEGYKLRESNK